MAEMNADNYLLDLGMLLKEAALDARKQARGSSDATERTFDQGRAMAYYEVVSLMKEQAVAFGIDPARVSLADIDPDRDLI